MSPPGRTLIGSGLPPTRALMATWATGVGWLLSCTAYGAVFGGDHPEPLMLAVPVALLSGAAVYWAGGKNLPTAGQIVGASVFASCLCPLATILPLMLFSVATENHSRVGELLGMTVCFSVFGAFFTIPFGMGFGALFAAAWRAIDSGRGKGHRSALEIAWAAFGAGWVLVGVTVLVLSAEIPLRSLYGGTHGPNLITAISASLTAVGAIVLFTGVCHHLRRRHLADLARRGRLRGYAVVPISEVEDAGHLPALFPSGPLDGVLVRRVAATGPFRDSPDVPVARVALSRT